MILYYYCVDFVPHPSTTEERHYTCKTIEDVNLLLSIFDALDILWRNMDYEVWNLTITPYWEEVYTDA